MKFTLSWLKDHLETEATLTEITERLVNLGVEVESVYNPAESLQGFVVGHVVDCGRHPNADRLNLCKIDSGTGELTQVICGAPNVRQGLKIAFAPLGVVIPATGQVLKKGKIRDIESFGMCCSSQELNLGHDSEGIIELDPEVPVGTPIAEILGLDDPVIEVAITPNRADCFGVRGIARDLAASGLGTLKPLPYPNFSGQFESPLKVVIEDNTACPAFHGVYLRGVTNRPSPTWVQHRLEAIGLRPINALVDVTNYLTYDLCRPLHVFDADKVTDKLTVRLSQPNEKLIALNGKEYVLDDQMTVIADAQGPLALGGIMGGEASGCTESTTHVFVECALFDPIRTAHTGRKLQILSDSRTRFERGIDPESLNYGLEAAVALIQEWCGGTVSHRLIAAEPNQASPKTIALTQEKLSSLSGTPISLADAEACLSKLGFTVQITPVGLNATPPSYRLDIEEAADLVEEILRLQGYDAIEPIYLPPTQVHPLPSSKSDNAKRLFAARGLNEVVTWSFMKENLANLFGFQDPTLKLENPISTDLAVMRPSILPNLIEATLRNHSRGIENARFFEVGPQYTDQSQQQVAAGLCFGQTSPRHWSGPPRDVDVFDAKSHVLALFATLGVSDSAYQVEPKAPAYYHPGRSGTFKQGNRVLAYFGEIHPKINQYFNSDSRMVGFEIFLDHLSEPKTKKSALTLSPYQPVMRDFAFIIDTTILADQLIKIIQKVDRALITVVDIFDVYEGDKVPSGKKSIAISVRLEPQHQTLTDSDIQNISTKIITHVEKATGGSLRAA